MSKFRTVFSILVVAIMGSVGMAGPTVAQQSPLPETPLNDLVVTFETNEGYGPQEIRVDGYLFQNGEPTEAMADANALVIENYKNAGVVDAYARVSLFNEEVAHSTLYPEILGSVQLQARVLTFQTDEQASNFVNSHPQMMRDELAAVGDTSQVIELMKLPFTPGDASGWRTEVPSTSTDGAEYMRTNVNYTAQSGSTVVMARAFALPDLAEPMAREVFLLQMVCVQLDTACDTLPVPSEFPMSEASQESFPEGKMSTSFTAEKGTTEPSADEAATEAPAEETTPTEEAKPKRNSFPGSTAASLPVSGAEVETSGNWLVSVPVVGDQGEALVLAGSNDNGIVAVVNGTDAAAVETAVRMVLPGIGELTPVEIAEGHTLHAVTVDGTTYGVFSTYTANDKEQVFVVSYIAPISTFDAGMADLQNNVAVNSRGMFQGADGQAIKAFFVGAVGEGDATAEAGLEPLFLLTAD